MDQLSIQYRHEFDNIVNHVGQYIVQWMQNQLRQYSDKKDLLLQIDKHNYLLGSFRISYVDNFWKVSIHNETVHDFLNKTAAIVYCLYYNSNDIQGAKYLLDLDRSISNLLYDQELYQYLIKRHNNNYEKTCLYRARLGKVNQRINMLSKQMQKNLILAKYKKLGKFYESDRH